MSKGKLIVFEGGEGSGKSTIVDELYNWCVKNDIRAIKSREPGGTDIGEDIREILLGTYETEMDVITELLLFEAARRQHYLKVIKPALDAGVNVILDRFTWSTIAIQGYKLRNNTLVINYLNNLAIDEMQPDYVIVLDIFPDVALKRIKDNNREINRIDAYPIAFHDYVRRTLISLSHNHQNTSSVVDADQPKEYVFKDVLKIIKGVINNGRIYEY